MPTASYDIGDQRRLTGNFTNVNNAPADPGAIALTIREPDGVQIAKTEADMQNPATGEWYYDFTIAKPGRHIVRWAGSGAIIAAGEDEFYARRREA